MSRARPGIAWRIALLVGAAAGLGAATIPVSDPDLFWHLATARETLARGLVTTDLFSWSVRGAPVSIDQWLGQLVLYAAYVADGWRGVVVLRVLEVTALVALVVANASLVTRRPLAAVLAAVPAIVLTRAVTVDRPELLGLVLFAGLLVLLRRGRDGSTAALAGAVALVAVWANVHGSFALGAVLTVLVCAEGALRGAARRRVYAATALAAVAATLATPAGVTTWTAPGIHLLSPPRGIQEWATIDVSTPLGAAYAATLALVLAAALRGPRVEWRELVVLVPVAFLSLTAARQAPLLAIAAAPLFGERAAWAIGMARARLGRPETAAGPDRATGSSDRAVALRSFGLLPPIALIALAIAVTPASLDERAYPVGALAALPRGDGVLARYEWGGWLIWRAPATPVFVDGRLTPYLGGVLDDYRTVVDAKPGWREVIERRGVRALLVAPGDPVAVRAREIGWPVAVVSATFVLIVVP